MGMQCSGAIQPQGVLLFCKNPDAPFCRWLRTRVPCLARTNAEEMDIDCFAVAR